jgi:2-oxoglutarate ferredoxin oxidoreductase subunit alpha
MTPVILLTDGYISQGTNPWRIPNLEDLPEIKVQYATDKDTFAPYKRDPETLSRPWAVPGTPGLEHRIGGLEKEDISGLVSHDPDNHQKMCELRAAKVEGIANDIPLAQVDGPDSGDLLVIGWGGTYGSISSAVEDVRKDGGIVSYVHLKYLNPFPRNLESIIRNFKKILIPEMNLGQLKNIIQSKFLTPVIGFNKIKGQPLKSYEVEEFIKKILKEEV